MGIGLCLRGFADLTDVTLADEDTNSILTDDTNRAIPGNMAMQIGANFNRFVFNGKGVPPPPPQRTARCRKLNGNWGYPPSPLTDGFRD